MEWRSKLCGISSQGMEVLEKELEKAREWFSPELPEGNNPADPLETRGPRAMG